MKILLTGGTGFIGYNIAKKLKELNFDFSTTFEPNENEIISNVVKLQDVMSDDGIRFDVVIHQAANNDTLSENKDEIFQSNILKPFEMFDKLRSRGCKKFIYASSTAVYGKNISLLKESTKPDPLNDYAKSKLEFEKLTSHYAENDDVSIIGLRYCNVFGPGEKHKDKRMSMIGQMLYNAYNNKETTLFKYGQQCRDWVYVDDVVNANLLALKYNGSGIFNIATSYSLNFLQLVDLIEKTINKKLLVNWEDCKFPEKYQEYVICSIDKARKELGYEPKNDLNTNIKKYWEFINH